MLKQPPQGQGELKERILQGEGWGEKQKHKIEMRGGKEGTARRPQGPGGSN